MLTSIWRVLVLILLILSQAEYWKSQLTHLWFRVLLPPPRDFFFVYMTSNLNVCVCGWIKCACANWIKEQNRTERRKISIHCDVLWTYSTFFLFLDIQFGYFCLGEWTLFIWNTFNWMEYLLLPKIWANPDHVWAMTCIYVIMLFYIHF